jgi:putative ABC transport system permease protein
MWVAISDLPRSAAHPFHTRLNQILDTRAGRRRRRTAGRALRRTRRNRRGCRPGATFGCCIDALRIPLRQGRLFTRRDGPGTAPAALVNESFASRRFPAGDAIGHRITLGDGEPLTIVGIVGDVLNEGLDRGADDSVYQPLAMNPGHYIRLAVRGDGPPSTLERPVHAALRAVDARVAIFHVQPMEDYVAASMAARRFALGLMATFGTLALLLAAIGLYGVLAFSVATKTPELGLRAALGATHARLLTQVLAGGIALVSMGIATGIVLAVGATRVMASLLYGVTPVDAPTFAASVALILCAGAAACLLPAWRAARVDPLTAIRRSA